MSSAGGVIRFPTLLRNTYVQLTVGILTIFLIYSVSTHSGVPLKFQLSPDNEASIRPQNLAPCARVPAEHLARLERHHHFSVHTFNQGRSITEPSELKQGTELCIIISVPQHNISSPEDLKDVPVPGKGPDNLHLYLKSPRVELSFEPPRPFPGQSRIEEQFAENTTLLYFAETTLYHTGAYEIYVDHEFANWRWANQWFNDFENNLIQYPTGLNVSFTNRQERISQMHDPTYYNWSSVEDVNKYPSVIRVQGDDEEWERIRMNTPCHWNVSTGKGRWYQKEKFPNILGNADEWGFVWDGSTCHLDFFNEKETLDCMAGTNGHLWGDSQLRRVTKALVSGGQFCTNLTHRCQHNDGALPVHSLITDDQGDIIDDFTPDNQKMGEFSHLPYGIARNSTVHFNFMRDLAGNFYDWTRYMYDATDNTRIPPDPEFETTTGHLHYFTPAEDLRIGAIPHEPTELPPADFVVLGFGSWDSAFDPTFDMFRTALVRFRDAFLVGYPEHIPIVLRMSNGYCCHHTFEDYRRFTGTRIQHMNDMVREVFQIKGAEGMGGRILVWDPEPMTGQPKAALEYGEVQTNHPRFNHVRMETQHMLNKLCERDPKTKVVKLRRRQLADEQAD